MSDSLGPWERKGLTEHWTLVFEMFHDQDMLHWRLNQKHVEYFAY